MLFWALLTVFAVTSIYNACIKINPQTAMTSYQEAKKLYDGLYMYKRDSMYKDRQPTMEDVLVLRCSVMLSTVKTIVNLNKERLVQNIYSPLHLSDKFLCVKYYYNNTWYRFIIPKQNQGSRMLHAHAEFEDGSSVVITQALKELLGPAEDFHGNIVSPDTLGYKRIVIYTIKSNLDPLVFAKDEKISI